MRAEYMVAALDVLERHIAATVICANGRGEAEETLSGAEDWVIDLIAQRLPSLSTRSSGHT